MLSNLLTIIGLVVACGGLIFLARQVIDARNLAKSQFISTLENDLAQCYEAYTRLLPNEDWSNESQGPSTRDEITKLVRYLGFFAKLKFLLDLGTLDLELIDKMFAFRFFLAAHNRHVQDKILFSEMYEGHWSEIFALHRQWTAYRRTNSLPIPFSSTDLHSRFPERYRVLSGAE